MNLIFQKDTNCESILVHVPPTNKLKFFKHIKVIIFIHYTYLYLVGVNFFGQVLISCSYRFLIFVCLDQYFLYRLQGSWTCWAGCYGAGDTGRPSPTPGSVWPSWLGWTSSFSSRSSTSPRYGGRLMPTACGMLGRFHSEFCGTGQWMLHVLYQCGRRERERD